MAAGAARRTLNPNEKSGRCPVGTAFAFTSGTAFSGKPPPSAWGGARNRADRVSLSLTHKQAHGVLSAIAHASGSAGLPLNRHLTLHWGKYGLGDADAGKATGDFLKLAQQFMRSNQQPFAFVYVRENDEGDGSKGSHTHYLLHVPPAFARRFVAMQRRWLRIVTGKAYRKKAMHTARIGRTINAAAANRSLYAINLLAVAHYLLKAAEPAAVEVLGLTHRPAYGRVTGKRCGWSENIGKAARKRWTAETVKVSPAALPFGTQIPPG